MSNYSFKHTLLSPHVAAPVSVPRFHLIHAASDTSPRRDETSDGQNHNYVPL